jgi:hypothetical protein
MRNPSRSVIEDVLDTSLICEGLQLWNVVANPLLESNLTPPYGYEKL